MKPKSKCPYQIDLWWREHRRGPAWLEAEADDPGCTGAVPILP